MKRWRVVVLLAGCLALAHGILAQGNEPDYTSDFDLERCTFSSDGGNPWWSLEPGTRSEFEGEDDGEELELRITVLNAEKTVAFMTPEGKSLKVRTRIIEEREWVDGELVEVSRNFFARCDQTGDIYYFGEDVDIYEDGQVSHEGAWLAGRDGAQPGLIMPGTFLLGSRYFQEIAPDVALDRAEHTAMGVAISVPYGDMEGCVEVTETSPLDSPRSESLKIYCPGVGLVKDDGAELVEHTFSRRFR